MKTLLLLRHAKSSWDAPARRDFDRPLAARGQRDAPRMGRVLKSSDVKVDRVLCSTAQRARETAELALGAAGYKAEVEFTDAIYEASSSELLDLLRRQSNDHDTVMMIGHNPGFEDLLSGLCGNGGQAANIRMPTAALACIELDVGKWSESDAGEGTLVWLVIPKILGKGSK